MGQSCGPHGPQTLHRQSDVAGRSRKSPTEGRKGGKHFRGCHAFCCVLFCFLNHNQRNTFRNCRKPFSAKPHSKASKVLCQDKVKNRTQPAEYGVHLLSNQTLLQALKPVFVILAGSFKVRKAFCKCNLVQCHGSHRRQGPTCGHFRAGERKPGRP